MNINASEYSDHYYRTRIRDIADKDFWQSICADVVNSAAPKQRKYERLKEHHSETLGREYAYVLQETRKQVETPEALKEHRRKAEKVLAGHINGWGSVTLTFDNTVDFNADFGYAGQCGFHYLSWLKPVVNLYILDDDADCCDRLLDIVRQYYSQRLSIRRKKQTRCPIFYELGAFVKTDVLLPAYIVLVSRGQLAGGDVECFMKLFLGFGRSLFRFQRTGFRYGNQQIVGLSALFRLACTFPEFKESGKWHNRALRMQLQHLKTDLLPDGGHHERCVDYGWLSLKNIIEMYKTGLRFERLPSKDALRFKKHIRKAFQWYANIVTPTNIGPAFGDGDLIRTDHILGAAQEFFAEDKKLPGHVLGVDRGASAFLKPSGYVIMRDGAEKQGLYLNMNFGKSGGVHTHRNLLDFNIWGYGKPLIEEVGCFDSYDNPFHGFFRSEKAHNQAVIDERPMDRSNAYGKGISWKAGDDYDFFSAYHDGYEQIMIRRSIVFIKKTGFIVYDVVTASEYRFTTSFYLHSTTPFKELGPGKVITEGAPGCLIAFAEADKIRRLETGVDIAPHEITVSRLYGPRYYLRARKWRDIQDKRPITFVAAIYPFKETSTAVSLRNRSRHSYQFKCPKGAWNISFVPGKKETDPWSATVRRLSHKG